ncbi:hypothetical protein ACFVWG_25550 [Kribbella sp. NPDC058245]|uniref:hypothetical protein n=1 Tax=Kribbella sp. NPDC058245 TaxID=3346399 RepID=UPI0036E41CC1
MSVNWDGYKPFDPGVSGPLNELTRREARAAFERLMAAKSERIDELRRLLANNGVELSSSAPGLQALNDWFRSEVEGDPAVSRLRPIWYAVVNDIGLFLGDALIERNPHLKWVMFDKGKRDLAYQRHVIMGFTEVANPKYNVDPDLLVGMYGHRIIAGQGIETDAFVTWGGAA